MRLGLRWKDPTSVEEFVVNFGIEIYVILSKVVVPPDFVGSHRILHLQYPYNYRHHGFGSLCTTEWYSYNTQQSFASLRHPININQLTFFVSTQKLTYNHLIYPEGFLGAMSVSTSPGIPTPNSRRDIYFNIIRRFKSLLQRNGSRAILLNLTREGRISHSGFSSKSTVGVEKAHYIDSNISSPPLLSCGAWMISGTHYTQGKPLPRFCHVNLEASRINYLSRWILQAQLWTSITLISVFTVCIINMPIEYPPSIDPWNYSENWFILPRSEVEIVSLRRFDRRRALFKTLRISPCPIQIIVLQLPQKR